MQMLSLSPDLSCLFGLKQYGTFSLYTTSPRQLQIWKPHYAQQTPGQWPHWVASLLWRIPDVSLCQISGITHKQRKKCEMAKSVEVYTTILRRYLFYSKQKISESCVIDVSQPKYNERWRFHVNIWHCHPVCLETWIKKWFACKTILFLYSTSHFNLWYCSSDDSTLRETEFHRKHSCRRPEVGTVLNSSWWILLSILLAAVQVVISPVFMKSKKTQVVRWNNFSHSETANPLSWLAHVRSFVGFLPKALKKKWIW